VSCPGMRKSMCSRIRLLSRRVSYCWRNEVSVMALGWAEISVRRVVTVESLRVYSARSARARDSWARRLPMVRAAWLWYQSVTSFSG
jgi:hypothetical protein